MCTWNDSQWSHRRKSVGMLHVVYGVLTLSLSQTGLAFQVRRDVILRVFACRSFYRIYISNGQSKSGIIRAPYFICFWCLELWFIYLPAPCNNTQQLQMYAKAKDALWVMLRTSCTLRGQLCGPVRNSFFLCSPIIQKICTTQFVVLLVNFWRTWIYIVC